MLVKSPFEVMAEALHKATKGAGTKEEVLNEILGSCTKDDINQVKLTYETRKYLHL